MHKAIPVLLAAFVTTSAYAQKTYSITIPGLCDHYTLTDNAGAITGVSDADNCDDANMAGTKSVAKVAPNSRVLEVATNLGGDPAIFQLLFDLNTKILTIYYTPDGLTGYSDSTPFKFTTQKSDVVHNNGLPRLIDMLRHR